jgi:hypothetical protein
MSGLQVCTEPKILFCLYPINHFAVTLANHYVRLPPDILGKFPLSVTLIHNNA